jgi:hypothetical protein
VVVPVRDDARLVRLLASLSEQRGAPEFEVIVALDGARRLPPIPSSLRLRTRLLELPPDGPYAARNAGAAAARGELLLFTDSDCVCPPDWVARADRELDRPSVSALQGGSVAARDSRLSRWIQLEHERFVASHAATGFRRFCDTRSFAIRRDAFSGHPFATDRQRGADGAYGRSLEARGISIRYEPEWAVIHDHARSRRSFAIRMFRQGQEGARWRRAGLDLFGPENGSHRAPGAGARLLAITSGSRGLEGAASAALLGVSAVLGAATIALPYSAGRPVFGRFARAAHLAGRLAGESEAR